MIIEITELHGGKSTNPRVPVAAALRVLILPCSKGGLKVGFFFQVSFTH